MISISHHKIDFATEDWVIAPEPPEWPELVSMGFLAEHGFEVQHVE